MVVKIGEGDDVMIMSNADLADFAKVPLLNDYNQNRVLYPFPLYLLGNGSEGFLGVGIGLDTGRGDIYLICEASFTMPASNETENLKQVTVGSSFHSSFTMFYADIYAWIYLLPQVEVRRILQQIHIPRVQELDQVDENLKDIDMDFEADIVYEEEEIYDDGPIFWTLIAAQIPSVIILISSQAFMTNCMEFTEAIAYVGAPAACLTIFLTFKLILDCVGFYWKNKYWFWIALFNQLITIIMGSCAIFQYLSVGFGPFPVVKPTDSPPENGPTIIAALLTMSAQIFILITSILIIAMATIEGPKGSRIDDNTIVIQENDNLPKDGQNKIQIPIKN